MARSLNADVLNDYMREHYPYEISMLNETYSYLSLDHGRVINNALIESFCIHARQLIEFYRNKQDVHASHFMDETYRAKYVAANTGKVGNSLYNKLNQQIAHMTDDRTTEDKDKIGSKERKILLEAINEEDAKFRSELGQKFRNIIPKSEGSERVTLVLYAAKPDASSSVSHSTFTTTIDPITI